MTEDQKRQLNPDYGTEDASDEQRNKELSEWIKFSGENDAAIGVFVGKYVYEEFAWVEAERPGVDKGRHKTYDPKLHTKDELRRKWNINFAVREGLEWRMKVLGMTVTIRNGYRQFLEDTDTTQFPAKVTKTTKGGKTSYTVNAYTKQALTELDLDEIFALEKHDLHNL